MTHKQLSWRCSNQALSIILLFSSFFVFSMESESIYGVRYKDIDKTWETAPVAIKNWAEELKECNGSFRSLPYRLFLHGVPGTGKTTLGLGIWKQNNSEWDLNPVSAGDLISKNRGAAAEKLRDLFKKINPNRKTIFLLDEAHVLMEGASRESTDTSETTEALRNFLDANAQNRNFMAILTGNQVEDMKDSMKSRVFVRGIEIPPPSAEELSKIFQYYLQDEGFDVNQIDTNSFIAVNTAAGAHVGRDVKSFASLIKDEVRDDGYRGELDQYCIQQTFLLKVAALYKEKAKKFKVGEKSLSDREFQQKLHDEAQWNQKKIAALSFTATAGLAASAKAYDYYQTPKEPNRESSKNFSESGTNQQQPNSATNESSFFGNVSSAATNAASTAGKVGGAVVGGVGAGAGLVVQKSGLAGLMKVATAAAKISKGPAIATKGASLLAAVNPVVVAGAAAVIVVGGTVYYFTQDEEGVDELKEKSE